MTSNKGCGLRAQNVQLSVFVMLTSFILRLDSLIKKQLIKKPAKAGFFYL